MRSARIFYKNEEAGLLTQHNDGSVTFRYTDLWLTDSTKPSISLTLPKSHQEYHSPHLFPFFFSLLPEGANKQVACRLLRIDADDHFGLLLATAQHDTIGAVTVERVL
jgi:HipA-like protein